MSDSSKSMLQKATLPAGWMLAPIAQLATFNPKTDAHEQQHCGFAPMQGLGTRYLDKLAFEIRPWGEVRKSYTHFRDGDVLVAKVTPCFENGKAGIARDLPNGIGAGSSEFCVFRPAEGIDERYLLAWLSSEDFRRRATVSMTGSVGLKRVPKDFFLSEQIPLAPSAEQRRIADKLDTVLTRVDAVNARLARVAPLLKRFRQSVLAAAMSGRLTEDWRGAHPTVPLTKELLLESRLGHNPTSRDTKITHGLVESGLHVGAGQDLPENWLRSCIGMIGVVSNGSTPSRARPDFWIGPIHWVSSGEVRNRKIRSTNESITQLGFESSSVRLLPAGTVLIAMIGEGKTRGQSALLEIEATINQNIAAIVPVPELIESQYLWYWFQSQYETNRLAGNGSGPQALNCQKVRELPINLPPMEEQSEIIRRVETLFAFADRLEARLQAARTAANRLTPALLAKAFRGELVPQDPNDEPAAELLKRLAASAPATTKRRGRPAKAA